MDRKWSNAETELWNVSDQKNKLFMRMASIRSITHGPQFDVAKDQKIMHRFKDARVILVCPLPYDSILNLNNGDSLEVLHVEHGRRDVYANGDPIMRMLSINIVSMEVSDVVIQSPDSKGTIEYSVQFDCTLEVIL